MGIDTAVAAAEGNISCQQANRANLPSKDILRCRERHGTSHETACGISRIDDAIGGIDAAIIAREGEFSANSGNICRGDVISGNNG